MSKPCYFQEPNIFCIAENEECIKQKTWETCDAGKLSKEYEEAKKARHKKAVKLTEDILNYLFSEWFSKVINRDLLKNKLIKIIKKHL
jgi:hypothetical protein